MPKRGGDVGLDWDDIAFDPHQNSIEEGRTQGQKAGELAGYRDGQRLGNTKGIEFGMELGFIQGFVNSLMEEQEQEDFEVRSERLQRSLLGLQKALDDFPSPDALFMDNNHPNMIIPEGITNHDVEDDSETTVTKFDIVAKMQRVRARFKLLTVQLGMGPISLAQVLNSSTHQDDSTNEKEEIKTQEW